MPTITKAVDHGDYIMLTLDADTPYALYDDDPYGEAPTLRQELQRMVEAGEITIETEVPT
jgi:hypothetical protein